MTKADFRKSKLKVGQVHFRKAIHYKVIKRCKNYVEQSGSMQNKVKKIKDYVWS